jgi:hypothetical protein
MKDFLDEAFEKFNTDWNSYRPKIATAVEEFEAGVDELIQVFSDAVARKPTSRQFNRAAFDALIYFHTDPKLLKELRLKRPRIRAAYAELFKEGSPFLAAIESDTAGAPNTATRFTQWAAALSRVVGHKVAPPLIPQAPTKKGAAGKSSKKN